MDQVVVIIQCPLDQTLFYNSENIKNWIAITYSYWCYSLLSCYISCHEKASPRKETVAVKKRRKANSGKKRTVTKISKVGPGVDDDATDNKPVSKGTITAHFVKFVNELLDVMDLEAFKGCHLVMDCASIHKFKPMVQKIESRGYKFMYLSSYSPELNLVG
jgi:hypothetical protein